MARHLKARKRKPDKGQGSKGKGRASGPFLLGGNGAGLFPSGIAGDPGGKAGGLKEG